MSPGKPEFIGGDGFKLDLSQFRPSGRLRLFLILIIVLLTITGFLYSMFLEYVEPDEFGIKEVQIGVNKGIREEVYTAGLAFVMPFGFQRMHHLPRTVQVLELTGIKGAETGTAARHSQAVYHDPAAKIQTSDGFYVDVDATIIYRIADPYKVVTTLGPGDMYLHQGIRPKSEPVLKQALGQLTTEEFYNSPLRVEKAEKARELLDAEMRPKGIEVQHVLVRYFRYSDRIQTNIEEKKLQDQLVFTNKSKRKAAEAEQELNRVTTEGEMQVVITMEEGKAYSIRKEAEKELYTRSKNAEADLLIELAEAERSRLKNEAMQEQGSDRMVAIRMAEVLKGLETVLLPSGGPESMNPLSLDQVLKTFGVKTYAALPGEEEPEPAVRLPENLRDIKLPAPPPVPDFAAPSSRTDSPVDNTLNRERHTAPDESGDTTDEEAVQ
jgi:regulator of protease activity HflC (stomatin/prohibitin superfamily)